MSIKSRAFLAILAVTVTTVATAANHSHRRIGATRSGTVDMGGDQVRFFAGDYKGNFNRDDCNAAASKVYQLFRSAGLTARNTEQNTRPAHNSRMVVFGAANETVGNQWTYECVNISADGRSIRYIYDDKGPYSSTGWVNHRRAFNGHPFEFVFADQDNGTLTYHMVLRF